MTTRNKKIVVGAFIGVALVLDLIGSVLASDPRHSRDAGTLYTAATVVIVVGVIFILLNRGPR